MSVNYLQEIKGDLDGPSCHVCGAIMIRVVHRSIDETLKYHTWKCLSCGTTTGCEREVKPMSQKVCTCDDLVNNGDHYCPIHGTFAAPNWLGSNTPTAGMVTQVYQPADDTGRERLGASWSDTGTTIPKPAPSADGRREDELLLVSTNEDCRIHHSRGYIKQTIVALEARAKDTMREVERLKLILAVPAPVSGGGGGGGRGMSEIDLLLLGILVVVFVGQAFIVGLLSSISQQLRTKESQP